jgi:5-oxoprolinase (ATP-hydrolysing)
VEPGWVLEIGSAGELRLHKARAIKKAQETRPRAVQIELFTNRFEAITREMGAMLERTALSTNIKERLDFSCALLDPNGELVVNAPHIPVHLGAMGICVREVRRVLPMQDGDVVITNHPKFGGSHLPDVTLITPVYSRRGRLLGYVANRAHHAEIGGIQPGSMPPLAKNLAEEGVVIPPIYLVHEGKEQWDRIEAILRAGPYPSRAVEENLADIRAALAANHRGARLLQEMADQYGDDAVLHYMAEIKKKARVKIQEALSKLKEGEYRAVELLDDGSPLSVSMTVSGNRAVIDFSGSAGIHPGNLNATPAIVTSAVMYVLRLLLQEDFPLNEGMLHAVDIRIPPGILSPDFPDDPSRCPAVVGGNVETSQRLVDALLRPLEIVACSQGTMNNTVWGTDRFSYYETVCGGCGAGNGFHGASAVHSHMTNTRITDPEIIELRYPVRVMRFGIRRGSGGKGKFRGGDGVIREVLFLERMRLAVLTQHRVERPYGLKGGKPGVPGRQYVVRADGTRQDLSYIDGTEVLPGDRFVMETPGGGGYGPEK